MAAVSPSGAAREPAPAFDFASLAEGIEPAALDAPFYELLDRFAAREEARERLARLLRDEGESAEPSGRAVRAGGALAFLSMAAGLALQAAPGPDPWSLAAMTVFAAGAAGVALASLDRLLARPCLAVLDARRARLAAGLSGLLPSIGGLWAGALREGPSWTAALLFSGGLVLAVLVALARRNRTGSTRRRIAEELALAELAEAERAFEEARARLAQLGFDP